jgi:RNA polymerase sigma-70 factor (ECF subfamily)
VRKKYWDYYKTFVPQVEDSTEKIVNYNQLLEALEQGMEHLPKKTKTIFQLNRLEGRSISEIAKILNLSEKAIEYHLTSSLKHLRVHLKNTAIMVICFAMVMF